MMTAPTSAMARPKPAIIAVSNRKRPSQSRVATLCIGVQPSERRCSSYSSCRSAIVCRDSAAMIGRTMMLWAMIMAAGVNRRPIGPSGPARDNSRYTTSPTTTGGRPMSALSKITTPRRPGKFCSAMSAPSGSAMTEAIVTAPRLTCSDNRTISTRCSSSVRIIDSAATIADENSFIVRTRPRTSRPPPLHW